MFVKRALDLAVRSYKMLQHRITKIIRFDVSGSVKMTPWLIQRSFWTAQHVNFGAIAETAAQFDG